VEGGDCGLILNAVLPLEFALRDPEENNKNVRVSVSQMRYEPEGTKYETKVSNIKNHTLQHSLIYTTSKEKTDISTNII